VLGPLAVLACGKTPSTAAQAALLVDHGQTREAAELLEARLREEPNDTEARRQLIRVLGIERRLDDVAKQAELLATQLGEHSPVPWLELGHAFELAHRYDEALAFYDRAAVVAPTDPIGPRTGGMRAARWGELEWAEPRLSEATRRDPSHASTWHALGLTRVHQGRYKEAKDAYLAGLSAEPRSFENRIGLATVALRLEDYPAALAQYDQLAAERPGYADAHLGRAFALWRMGRTESAAEALHQAREQGADPRVTERLERAIVAPSPTPPTP
jgi:tetratricopeptide (TPR) repeat protein